MPSNDQETFGKHAQCKHHKHRRYHQLHSSDTRKLRPSWFKPFLLSFSVDLKNENPTQQKKTRDINPILYPVPPFCQGQVLAHGKPAAIPRKTFCEHGAWSISAKEFLHCIALELWGKHIYIDDTDTYSICCIKHVSMSFMNSLVSTLSRARRIMEATTNNNVKQFVPIY